MPFRCKIKQKAYNRKYYEANKEKIRLQHKAYHQTNKEAISIKRSSYRKAYYKANKESEKVRSKKYYEANKERCNLASKAYYQANKEKVRLRDKAYYEATKSAYIARARYRDALKIKQVPIKVRNCPKEKKRLYQIYKLCDMITKATGVKHHVDHMWPLSKGGPHWSGNLQIITASANFEKHAKLDMGIKKTIQEMLRDIKDVY